MNLKTESNLYVICNLTAAICMYPYIQTDMFTDRNNFLGTFSCYYLAFWNISIFQFSKIFIFFYFQVSEVHSSKRKDRFTEEKTPKPFIRTKNAEIILESVFWTGTSFQEDNLPHECLLPLLEYTDFFS